MKYLVLSALLAIFVGCNTVVAPEEKEYDALIVCKDSMGEVSFFDSYINITDSEVLREIDRLVKEEEEQNNRRCTCTYTLEPIDELK